MVQEEFSRIDKELERAIDLISRGKIKGALRIATQLRRSWAVGESERAIALIEGFALIAQDKPQEAKELCLRRIYYLWNYFEALFLIRQVHAAVDSQCSFYEVLIKGGAHSVGFGDSELFCNLLVVAKDELEAAGYCQEITGFSRGDPQSFEVVAKEIVSKEHEIDNRGVYSCSPFRRNRGDAYFLDDSSDTKLSAITSRH